MNSLDPIPSALDATAGDGIAPDEPRVITLVEERLEIGRRTVDTGRTLRVRKIVDEETVEIDEPTLVDMVDVERVAIDRVIDAPAAIRYEGDVIVVPVVEERVVVSRQLVLIEEIRIARRREQRPVQQSVTLRRERVVIERFDPVLQTWSVVDDTGEAGLAPGPDPPAALV